MTQLKRYRRSLKIIGMLRPVLIAVAFCDEIAHHAYKKFRQIIYKHRFGKFGSDFRFDPDGTYTFETIYCGSYVNLGQMPCITATNSKVSIGSHVMLGTRVSIRGGNHRTDLVGRFMDSVKESEKRPEDDLGVVIEDDVWIGDYAIILNGVRVGRGSIIGAGAVVTKSLEPYSVAVGCPARVVKRRFDARTIVAHERGLQSA